jgi:hypothetical protein
MQTLKDTISGLMEELRKKQQDKDGFNPEQILQSIFSNKELQHVQFSNISKGILYINVDSSTWLYYFNLQKNELLGKLLKQFPAIKGIRFSFGQVVKQS